MQRPELSATINHLHHLRKDFPVIGAGPWSSSLITLDLVRKKKTSVMEWFGVKKFLETFDRRKIWYFWPIVNFLNASFPGIKWCFLLSCSFNIQSEWQGQRKNIETRLRFNNFSFLNILRLFQGYSTNGRSIRPSLARGYFVKVWVNRQQCSSLAWQDD